ncbi:MAG: ATP-dependent RecD-like DNA helicase [Lachnospiraceae bacterium]|nr:ATP-dependent RecD-like DNA helicase [Lachnospiraceae bacterium]
MDTIQGFVEHIIFRNSENSYTVMSLTAGDGSENTLVGIFPLIDEGEYIQADGEYVEHPNYGAQFKVSSYIIREPDTIDAMLRYLSAGTIKGIRESTAKKIIKRFGTETFQVMDKEPERLAEIKGISLQMAQKIGLSFAEKAGARHAMMYLSKYGINGTLAVKIHALYKDQIYEIIEKNPYQLTESVRGIGFKTADEIAERAGIGRHSEERIRSGILYTLNLSENEGNVYLPEEELINRASAILSVGRDEVEYGVGSLAIERKLIKKKSAIEDGGINIYSERFYYIEESCADLLYRLFSNTKKYKGEIEEDIERIEESQRLFLAENQREAVFQAIKSGIFIMTGGPGTGKTTTIKVLIKFFLSHGMDVSLAAPTGRAAKRLSEAAGLAAKTIHRMLEVTGVSDEDEKNLSIRDAYRSFNRNEDNPLDTDVVIIDEMSMVDIILFRSLLRAISPGTKLIMVGDAQQLPSVGPGTVLRDLINSGRFPVCTLDRIFRQAQESDIVLNAHALLSGSEIKLDNKSKDFFFLERSNPEEIIQGIIYLVTRKLPPYVRTNAIEVQVMSPMKKGVLGVENLNIRLQAAINPADRTKTEISLRGGVLRVGDKVMQTRNNYQQEWTLMNRGSSLTETGQGVFNGDIGQITEINKALGEVTVRFDDGRISCYEGESIGDLELAYAITIHKSQGSEYPAVVIPLLTGPKQLFNRNLLYTAITRAKSCVCIMGSKKTVHEMSENKEEQKRYSSLVQRLNERFEREPS